jgi:hypothetical protein
MIFRKLLVVGALTATLLPAVPVTPSVAMSDKVEASLLSKGKGNQTFIGGGLTYGSVSRGGSLRVRDISGDLSKTINGTLPRRMPDGSLMYVFNGKSTAFKLAGKRYEVILKGSSTLNGIGVYGKATFRGTGTYQLSGSAPLAWNGSVDLGRANGKGRHRG